jgi:hypothetical protein
MTPPKFGIDLYQAFSSLDVVFGLVQTHQFLAANDKTILIPDALWGLAASEGAMKKVSIIAVTIASSVAANAQQGLTLTVGRLVHNGSYARQSIAVKNNRQNMVDTVWIECGFFKNNQLISTGSTYLENIAPGMTGYNDVTTRTELAPDSAECRLR